MSIELMDETGVLLLDEDEAFNHLTLQSQEEIYEEFREADLVEFPPDWASIDAEEFQGIVNSWRWYLRQKLAEHSEEIEANYFS